MMKDNREALNSKEMEHVNGGSRVEDRIYVPIARLEIPYSEDGWNTSSIEPASNSEGAKFFPNKVG